MDFINNVKIIDMRVVPGDSGFLLDDGETCKDYIVEIYPIDAMKLNTSIMIDLIQKELL